MLIAALYDRAQAPEIHMLRHLPYSYRTSQVNRQMHPLNTARPNCSTPDHHFFKYVVLMSRIFEHYNFNKIWSAWHARMRSMYYLKKCMQTRMHIHLTHANQHGHVTQ